MRNRFPAAVVTASVAALALAACGSDDKSSDTKPTPLAVSVSESGKKAVFAMPAKTKGGLVTVTLTNQGKAPHSAQLVRYTGDHTVDQVLKIINSDQETIPDWIRGEGGVGQVAPGAKGTATVNLPEGNYVVQDQTQEGPGATKAFTVTKGNKGDLPSTSTTITAAENGKDKWKWNVSGALKPGSNDITFKSEGDDAIHFIGAFRVTGDPSLAEISKALASQNGPPPKFLDTSSFYNTAILDGGLSQTTQLPISKAGTWVLFCPLKDRDGKGKSHDQEGLLTKIQVK